MYMQIRGKLSRISDVDLVDFLNTNKTRQDLMKEHDLAFHESEQVFGVGFQIKDRIIEIIKSDNSSTSDKCAPFVIDFWKHYYPSLQNKSDKEILIDWLDKGRFEPKFSLAAGIFFLNHYKRHVEAKTIYQW